AGYRCHCCRPQRAFHGRDELPVRAADGRPSHRGNASLLRPWRDPHPVPAILGRPPRHVGGPDLRHGRVQSVPGRLRHLPDRPAVHRPPPDPGFAASVRALPEVEGLTLVRRLYVPPNLGYADVFALDPETYLSTTNPEPWYFRDIDRGAAQRVLASPDCDPANNRTGPGVCQVLVTEAYMDSQSLAVGDVLTFRREMRN